MWFRLQEPASDGASALAFVRARLEDVIGGDSAAWRWVILGLHLALQDFVVAAFPNNLFATDEKRADRFVSGMERGVPRSDLPDLRIDWFPNLYARMKESTGYSPGDGVDRLVVGSPDGDVYSLHSLRNDLVHHFPGGLSVPALLLLDRVEAALTVVDHLGWRQQYTNHVYWHDEAVRDSAREDLDGCLGLACGLRDELRLGT